MELKGVLSQALSRNKAGQKKDMWEMKAVEDTPDSFAMSLKNAEGELCGIVPKLPETAKVTANDANKYEAERLQWQSKKEDAQLNKYCDGKNNAWRPDSFFEDVLEEKNVPWPMRPTDFFSNPNLVSRVVSAYEESRKQEKLKRKKEEEKAKKEKKDKKGKKKKDKDKKKKKKGKKEKKSKKEKKAKKEKKEKKEKEPERPSNEGKQEKRKDREKEAKVEESVPKRQATEGPRNGLHAGDSKAEVAVAAKAESSEARRGTAGRANGDVKGASKESLEASRSLPEKPATHQGAHADGDAILVASGEEAGEGESGSESSSSSSEDLDAPDWGGSDPEEA